MLQLQRNVPTPGKRSAHGNRKYPFDRMTKVGDFFFIPHKRRDAIRSYLSAEGARRDMRIKSEQIHAIEDPDGNWTQCPEETDGAVSGIGVWRVE
jgi:hypothetical protein